MSTSKIEDDKKYVLDTNVLLDNPTIINNYNSVILACVLSELDKHKTNRDRDLRYKTREVCRTLIKNKNKLTVDIGNYGSFDCVDNEIASICLKKGYGLITSDLYLYFKACALGIDVIQPQHHNEIYVGQQSIELSDEDLASLYETGQIDMDINTNQYLMVKQYGEVIDKFKWNGKKLLPLKFRSVNKIKPINDEQHFLFDLLQDKNITIKACFGALGSGKDYIMLNHALSYIESGKFDKLIWARNNVSTKGVPRSGFLPGDLFDKTEPFLAPLKDHIGEEYFKTLLAQGRIELQHLSMIRGRDIKNSIIYVTECQNTTKEIMALLITRVGTGSQLWVNGDIKQTDNNLYDTNSGILALQKLRGQDKYGQVDLVEIERSETAKLASLLYT